jgi:hypothetical protein
MLSQEQRAQAERREAASSAAASAGGASAGEAGGSESAAGAESAETTGGGEAGGDRAAEVAPRGEDEPESARTGNDPRVPADVGDGRDDDIVARQIREAAMKEEDPELREKLWEEYRAYKEGQG